MKRRKFIKGKTAVAGVLEAILLIGLVAIVLSIIQFAYIPVIMEQREADHMDEVLNQLSSLKSVIEIQSMMGAMGSGESILYTPMSSPIALGSEKFPYFITERGYGQVDVTDQDAAGDHIINIQPAPADFPSGIPLTSLKYEAFNSYFVDQTYVLEGGGIILKQSNGEVMRVNPGIAVENNSALGYIKIYWTIPLFNGVPGKNITAGYKESYVRTNYSNHYTHSGSPNYIYIYTDYPDAWNKSLIKDDTGLLWEYHNNGYLNVEVDDSFTPDRVEITPNTKSINLELTIVEIGVQVGAGEAIDT